MADIFEKKDIEQFVNDGFVRIDNAFSSEIAEEAVDILWKDIPFDRLTPSSWVEPVVRLGMYTQRPFIDSVNTERLYAAFDALIGPHRWMPCRSVGAFPIRFPSEKQPNDTGKHVDAGFPGDNSDNYFEWRVNVRSKGRALLMLVLYSDVNESDAPTVIYRKSHMDVARLLYPEGDAGLSFMDLAGRLDGLPKREAAFATGKAGTVYLCHPFMVHAAQAHCGDNPKFMAQPPLLLKDELVIDDSKATYTPVEAAIRRAIR